MTSLDSKPLLRSGPIVTPKQNTLLIIAKHTAGNVKYHSLRLTLYYPTIDSQILSDLSECNLETTSRFFKMHHESSWFRKVAISKPVVSLEEIANAFTLPQYPNQDTSLSIVSRELSDLFRLLKTTREALKQNINSSAILFLADLCDRLKTGYHLEPLEQTIRYLERVQQHPTVFKGWSTVDTMLHDHVNYIRKKLQDIQYLIKTKEQRDSAVEILTGIKYHISQKMLEPLLNATIRLTLQAPQSILLTTYFAVKHQQVASDANIPAFAQINSLIQSDVGRYFSLFLSQAYSVLNEDNNFVPEDFSAYYHRASFSEKLSGLHPVYKKQNP